MNDPATTGTLTDAFFDAIVDGWLSPAQLSQAIERLDREPEGWKRCALAFLEAQAWRESFRSIEGDRPIRRPAVPSPYTGGPASPWFSPARTRPFALAAAIAALAFSLGWWLHSRRSSSRISDGTALAVVANPSEGAGDVTTGDLSDHTEFGAGTAEAEGPPTQTPPIRTVGRLRVGTAQGAPAVPILGGTGLDERWVANQPPPITDHQIALLQQSGYRIDRQRRLILTTLRDGRRLAVPIDRFQVRYTGTDPL